MSLRLHNPHSVLAALKQRPQAVQQVVVPAKFREDDADPWSRVVALARRHKIPIQAGPSDGGKSKTASRGAEGGRLSVMSALVEERSPVSIEELFGDAREKSGGRGLWLALDSLQDPQNVGSVFRTAAFFGVEGIVLTQERSAPLSATVYDVASGGMESVPFTLQVNLQRAFEKAKDAGLWILGTSEHAGDDLFRVERDRPWLLVLGNEEKGMRRLTEEACDLLCRIPAAEGAGVTSLNVSMAAAIAISAISKA